MKTNSVLGNMKNIMSWTILSQVLAGLSFFIISRIYDSSAIGIYGFYIAIVSVVASCSTFRIEMSLPISKSNDSFIDNYNLVNKINFYFSLLVLLISSVAYIQFDNLNPFAISLSVFFFGLYRILNMKALYLSDFSLVGKAKFVQVFIMIWIQVSIGYFFADSSVMILGFILGYLLSVIYYNICLKSKSIGSRLSNEIVSFKKSVIKKIKYVKYDTPAIFINTLSNELPSMLFPLVYGVSQAGYYVMAYRILIVPVTFIGSTLGQVLLSRAPTWLHEKVLFPKLCRVMIPLTVICFIGIFFSVLFVKDIFIFLLGDSWDLTAQIMSVLCIATFVQFVYSPYSVLIQLLNIQYFNFMFHLFMLLSKFIFIYVFSFSLNFEMLDTLKLLVVTSVLGYSFFLISILKYSKNMDSN